MSTNRIYKQDQCADEKSKRRRCEEKKEIPFRQSIVQTVHEVGSHALSRLFKRKLSMERRAHLSMEYIFDAKTEHESCARRQLRIFLSVNFWDQSVEWVAEMKNCVECCDFHVTRAHAPLCQIEYEIEFLFESFSAIDPKNIRLRLAMSSSSSHALLAFSEIHSFYEHKILTI